MVKYIHMVAVLVGISLVSGLSLGWLNSKTFELAKNNVLRFKKIPAVIKIYEGFSGPVDDERKKTMGEELLASKIELDVGEEGPLLVFVINKDGKPHTLAIEREGEGGYGGNVGVMMGFNIQTGNLDGVGITVHKETPGVGSKVEEHDFRAQFVGMKKDSNFALKKAGGDVDGISGATRSSTAVADGLKKAQEIYGKHREEILSKANEQAGGL